MNVTQERLRELLDYNAETGDFYWRSQRGRFSAGSKAGSLHVHGYMQICVDGRSYGSHRLAWIYVHGQIPNLIDHINGIRDDNRICNLRNVDHRVNAENRKSHRAGKQIPFIGVRKQTLNDTYSSSIKVQGKTMALGTFKTPEEAHAAYVAAKAKYHHGSMALKANLSVL